MSLKTPLLQARFLAPACWPAIARVGDPHGGVSGVWLEGEVIVGTDPDAVRHQVDRLFERASGALMAVAARYEADLTARMLS